ncbi:probable ATP-dependent RNA helicase DDX60 [Pristis pectinata]|uniref:probable ATP-dependent RNA helicase DDX60 n=1 Tax=Pristis pectinata TaxID=685728 RepID=UPI00223CF927|nr:probable ATP-dependent RNA helicase DDX60 [Pristis pectinata]
MAEAPETQDVLGSRATKTRVMRHSSTPEEQNAGRGGLGEADLDEENTVSPDEDKEESLDEESKENLDEESVGDLDEETWMRSAEGSDDAGMWLDETSSSTESEESEEEGVTWDGTVGSEVSKQEKVEGANPAKTLKSLSTYLTRIFTKFHRTSLLRDFVESEFFVIDGDSLMMMYIHNATVDPGQNLHFFYLVEWFLSDLIQKQAKFVIAFFKDLECIWNQSCLYLSIRTTLILHLQRNTKIPVHTEFSSCFDPKWKTFLEENHPYFVMISDTANPKKKRECLSTGLFHNLMIHTLGNGINVVLTSGVTQDILRLYGYHKTSNAMIISVFQEKAEDLKRAEDWMLSCAPAFHSQVFCGTDGKKLMQTLHSEIPQTISALKLLWPQGVDVRRIVCAVSCSVALKIYGYMVAMAKSTGDETGASANKEEELEELSEQGATELCRTYCLHVALLRKLPLAQRALKSKAKWKNAAMPFLLLRRMAEFLVLKELSTTHDWPVDLTYLTDLSDEHLFKSVVKICSERPACTGSEPQLGREIGSEYRNIWEAVATISPALDVGSALPVTCSPGLLLLPADTTESVHQEQGIPPIGLIPVTSDLVEEYLGKMLGQMPQLDSEDPTIVSLLKLKEFDEVLHWHSRKPLIETWHEKIQKLPTDPLERKSMLRQQQKYVVFERLYAESLEETATLTVASSQAEAAKRPSKKSTELIEAQKRKKLEEEERKAKEQWSSIQKSLGKEMTQDIDKGIKTLDRFLQKCNSDQVKVDAQMEGIKHCYNAWVEHCRSIAEPSRDVKTAVMLMQRIHTVLSQYEEQLSPKQLTKLAGYLKELGFLSLRDSLLERVDEQQKEKLKKRQMNDPKCPVGLGAARFQLKHMGPFLIRDERTDRDPRVRHFIPDTWQRELLDAVDNNESAVIVAPTSSGKTYASYYCMEKVLRTSDSGIVVYVAPTKALVNQVVATVYGRFTKDLPQGMAVCGCFTRDYRSHVFSCQVLVTVPQCLEILLLSPHQQDWAKRIQYVIFDEVHCLGGDIGAEVWEHLLVMIRCPFLALSATISNPEDLTQWLQLVKTYWKQVERDSEEPSSATTKQKGKRKKHTKSQSFKVRLVTYGERYNDLENFVCDFEDDKYKFVPYHPCAALTVDHIINYGIPSDLALSPAECLRLYDTMAGVSQGWPRAQELDPEMYKSFKNKIVIRRSDVREYEAELKKELAGWIETGRTNEVKDVLLMLAPKAKGIFGREHKDNFPLLVETLQKQNGLPAIFFMFNPSLVEGFADDILRHLLRKAQSKKKPGHDKTKLQIESRIVKLLKYLEKEKTLTHPSRKQAERLTQCQTEYESLTKKHQELQKLPPDCTFAQISAADQKFLDKVFTRLRWIHHSGYYRSMLRRGIGCHHRSLNKTIRQSVEMLFRRGFIKVVSATSTLALGINMPCKTVVFLEDSVYLDSLNYRQMSGRAGRRGLDNAGSVIFYKVPLSKVQRLLKANVPQLRGQFPLTITLVLRLMLLAAKADDQLDAKAKALSVLQYSLMTFNQPRKQNIVKYYFLFSLQFLLREGFLDREGHPQGFAGLVMHIHYHEPANFVFIRFLVQGLLHKLCQPVNPSSNTFSEDVMETLVLILANLFGRRHLPSVLWEQRPSFQQSKVFLNDLPEEFAASVKEYNENAIHVFGNFLLTISQLADLEKEFKLPLTNTTFPGPQEQEGADFTAELSKCLDSPVTAVSPFACLSGRTNHDLFNSYDVDPIIFRTLGIHMGNIPILPLKYYDRQGRHMPLNAYALDFYKHGSLTALTSDNGINRGEAYDLIRDFLLVISAISTSVAELCDRADDPVVLAFQQLQETYSAKLRKVSS